MVARERKIVAFVGLEGIGYGVGRLLIPGSLGENLLALMMSLDDVECGDIDQVNICLRET